MSALVAAGQWTPSNYIYRDAIDITHQPFYFWRLLCYCVRCISGQSAIVHHWLLLKLLAIVDLLWLVNQITCRDLIGSTQQLWWCGRGCNVSQYFSWVTIRSNIIWLLPRSQCYIRSLVVSVSSHMNGTSVEMELITLSGICGCWRLTLALCMLIRTLVQLVNQCWMDLG